ncbi:MAG: hypothetical protein AAGH83_00400 [Pseudomonadota bacterium]
MSGVALVTLSIAVPARADCVRTDSGHTWTCEGEVDRRIGILVPQGNAATVD